MSRIHSKVKPKFRNIKKDLVKQRIEEYFVNKNKEMESIGKKPRLSYQEKMKKEMIEFVFELINEQLEFSYVLNLNDKLVSEKINVSERRAKQIRLELRKANVIWFPEWSRPKAMGHYPKWMLVKEFIEFEEFEVKKTKVVKNRKYKPLYYVYYNEAKKEAYDELIEYDLHTSIEFYMQRVYKLLNENLSLNDLNKDMLLV